MRRIVLSRPEQATLESTFKTTTDRRLRDRCQAVLMASRGRKRTEIAQDLGWTWPHHCDSSASFVLGKQKLHGKQAQMAPLSHMLALLSGSIRQ